MCLSISNFSCFLSLFCSVTFLYFYFFLSFFSIHWQFNGIYQFHLQWLANSILLPSIILFTSSSVLSHRNISNISHIYYRRSNLPYICSQFPEISIHNRSFPFLYLTYQYVLISIYYFIYGSCVIIFFYFLFLLYRSSSISCFCIKIFSYYQTIFLFF